MREKENPRSVYIFLPQKENLLDDLEYGERLVFVHTCEKPHAVGSKAHYARPDEMWHTHLLWKDDLLEVAPNGTDQD